MAIHSSILAWENPMDQKPGRLPSVGWQIVGETMETVTDFILLGSKFTADGECSHEIKRYLLLGKKAITNIDGILKNRHCQQRSV